jgi:nitrogenase molybdenum-iron protein alpha/beta subunit
VVYDWKNLFKEKNRKGFFVTDVEAKYYTAEQLAGRIVGNSSDWIPEDFRSGHSLVYSSPATLAFNSPGAEGFGVKRAALSVPESIELIVSPRCCGHMSTDLPGGRDVNERLFFMELSEIDLVTGRYLKKIPAEVEKAIQARIDAGFCKPKAVLLVFTCVDALLGTDMDAMASACEKKTGVRVVSAPMFALTREGMNPPMVQVRRSIFSLLEKRQRNPHAVNVLGSFGGLDSESMAELHKILATAGITTIRTVADCSSYEEFQKMAEANFNIVIDQEARAAADDMEKRLGIGYIELQRFYGNDRIASQYRAFLKAIGVEDSSVISDAEGLISHADCAELASNDDSNPRASVENPENSSAENLNSENTSADFSGKTFAIGECANAMPVELALALLEYGCEVSEVFCALSQRDAWYILQIAQKSPKTRFYFNQHPTMIGFKPDPDVDICIGRDACWYYKDEPVRKITANRDRQPFGFAAVEELFKVISDRNVQHSDDIFSEMSDDRRQNSDEIQSEHTGSNDSVDENLSQLETTPWSEHQLENISDQSGAVSVVFPMDSLTVIIDAGGCTGNICGFDEPRWFSQKAMIFSAGLRDMDAIMGRDKELVRKIKEAAELLHPSFITLIGTPVPSVIGTDYAGLKHEIEKQTGIPVAAVNTNGMDGREKGIEKAKKALKGIFPEKD